MTCSINTGKVEADQLLHYLFFCDLASSCWFSFSFSLFYFSVVVSHLLDVILDKVLLIILL
jgi:hypothetical protein